MNILFIHQNFPGQFSHISAELARDRRNRVVALTMMNNPAAPGVTVRPYTLIRSPAPDTHPLLRSEETKILRAEACAAAAFQLLRQGFRPDLIVAHPGWGEALFIKDVFPHAKLVVYCEYYYALEGQDVGFDPEQVPFSFVQKCALRLKNTTNLLSLEAADAAISPTHWQKSTYPAWAQDKITVIHDGIDANRLVPNPKARLDLGATENHGPLSFRPGDEVLSYVARNLEPVRGFHMLMRTLPEVLRRRPKAHIVIVGGDEVSYGAHAPAGLSWKQHMLTEVGSGLDRSRVHFVGKIPYSAYLSLLNVSRLHTYWTVPFVLSWSFLEAAVNGVPIVASDTQPVREFADLPGLTTVGFFEREQFAEAICERLARPAPRARTATILPRIEVGHCLQEQKKWLLSV